MSWRGDGPMFADCDINVCIKSVKVSDEFLLNDMVIAALENQGWQANRQGVTYCPHHHDGKYESVWVLVGVRMVRGYGVDCKTLKVFQGDGAAEKARRQEEEEMELSSRDGDEWDYIQVEEVEVL